MSVAKEVETKNTDQSLRYKLLEVIKGKGVVNPVLQRLRQSVDGRTGLAITSYDRMHHRHNRK
jgi:hypothetical protein